MSIEAIEAVIDLIELGAVSTQADIVKCLRSALKEPEPKRDWVGLTDETIWLEYQRFWPFHPAEEPTLAKDIVKFARAIEAKLKEKNT